ncbi:hypothetical protein CIL03_04915 [Virgibacillus indicus]|uniref:Transcriptional regulator n=1 Tax=Virgibacillus indicus TaxID=2024554 RepID=A0A265NF82_9BACI|nr:sugar diacid recognition domain-containing protein [Virgibacillus indicus]OZU90491.1 hypothetical protein CIL03_04915 [Virgibacillus indicus]
MVQFAQRIVKAVSEISPFPISLTDEKGYIIGDSEKKRIGTLHTPSKLVLEEDRLILFDEETISAMENVLPGAAVPLRFDYRKLGVLGIIGDPQKVRPYVNLLKKYVEMMWQETMHQQLEQLEKQTLETFVQYILLNEEVNKERVIKFCEVLQINYMVKRYCVIVDIGDSLLNRVGVKQNKISFEYLKNRLIDHMKHSFKCNDDAICTFLNTEKIVLLKSVTADPNSEYVREMENFSFQSKQLMKKFQEYQIENITIAAGDLYSSLLSINRSYHEAENLINVGNELHLLPRIYNYYNWDMLLELVSTQMDKRLQEKLHFRLKFLIEHNDFGELSNDFMIYCKNNMNISKTAKELYIHRNTLIYRLKKIERITRLDTGCFEHCTLLYLVLKKYTDTTQKNI